MTFAPGDRVHLPGIGTGVVREMRNGGRCVIEIKGGTMVVDAQQLERAEVKRGKTEVKRAAPAPAEPESTGWSTVSRTLDLHGRTALEAIEALDEFLNDALLEGQQEVRVIHGRSGGRLKAAVHQRLGQLQAVRSFRVDPGNPGVTIVVF